jgi:hypothetical protein
VRVVMMTPITRLTKRSITDSAAAAGTSKI